MHQCFISLSKCTRTIILIAILCLHLIFIADANQNHLSDEISINCGSNGDSESLDGRKWVGDTYSNFSIKGSSTKSTLAQESAISVPYKTARISNSQFSYVFRVDAGQKLIRLHFNPVSYNGFKRFDDFFSVEAGPFTLLSNFSASINADAFGVNVVVKEFCVVIDENYPLNITFFPVGSGSYAFVNGIEVVSVPDTLLYCHIGGRGVQVVGEKFLVYVDNSTALEMVHRRNVKRDSVIPGGDFQGVFGMWGAGFNRKGNEDSNMIWRASVDVGFRYLVRLHFCEVGLKMVENGNTSFSIAINAVVVCTNADVLAKMEDKHGLFYRNYMVVAKGRKLEGKREITISFRSRDEFMYGHGPLEGFEIFKLSNHDNSLASPNPLPPARDSAYWSFRKLLSVLGSRNTVSAVVIIVISLVNIVVHLLRQTWEANFPEEEIKPTTRVTRTCRCFSLYEIHEATKSFDDACVIGKGGFGKVYKGFIDNGTEIVAIKRLKPDSKQGKREFWAEVETLSELRHVNLVSLIGYCNEQQEMILVYDYMLNGTLADHLYKLARKNSKFSPLSWDERLKICIGAGRGLDYLHTGKGVLHRDVKTSNILLDETFVAKIGDFGLAKTDSFSGMQNQDTTNLKGTFGYIDPDYFKTRKLTTKSDTYAFGVVLLEVLCGRPAVDPLATEDGRSLTIWARDNIARGEVDRILAPSLSGGISPDSLNVFIWIVERCLHDEPNKRPSIARVVTNLEFALDQHNGVTSFADFVPFTGQIQQSRFLVPNEKTNVAVQLENNANERTDFADVLAHNDRMSMPLTMASSYLQNVTSLAKEQSNSRTDSEGPSHGRKDGRKTLKHKLSRLLPIDTVWRKAKISKKVDDAAISVSAPLSKYTSSKASSSTSSTYQTQKPNQTQKPSTEGGINSLVSAPNFRIFSFLELKSATKNFKPDTLLGEGGFGSVFKGYLKEKSANGDASESIIAVKRLNHEGLQGLREWLAEVTFLGKLSHPNLVKLLGYCVENEELLLVYEYMLKGSLENHIFRRGAQMLSWDNRLKILIGAARGLEYLHTLDAPVIYRDFKTSNILLDELYNAKLADFGLAKSGPSGDNSHVSTRVIGTYGYAAPEYIATGHLTMKSDVYGFGVVLLEMLTGRRAIDKSRPSEQQFLVQWIMPHLSSRKKLMSFVDPRLEGNYPPKSVFQVYQLSKNCLQNDPKARPSMNEVVKILEALEKFPNEPKVRFS